MKSCNIENVSSPVSCYIGTKPTQDPNEYHNIDHDDHESKHLIGPADEHPRGSHEAVLSPQKVKHGKKLISINGYEMEQFFIVSKTIDPGYWISIA